MTQVTSRDGSVIAYEMAGRGPAVILVGGALSSRGLYGLAPLAETLAEDFMVVTYDRRGRGESTDLPPYAVEREIEDIEALIDEVGAPVFLYGLSSGAVLTLTAASQLGASSIAALALHEPPFSSGRDGAREFMRYDEELRALLAVDRRDDAVALFLGDMMPPDMLEEMRHSPEWPAMADVAHTLAYDNAVMGDSGVPGALAEMATMPTLVLVGDTSPDFKHDAARALAEVMPRAEQVVLTAQETGDTSQTLGTALRAFFLANQKGTERTT